jgi:hypothetical protein
MLPRQRRGRPRYYMSNLSIMCQKSNGLSMNSTNSSMIYTIENKIVNLIRVAKWQKNAGGNYAGNLHYVVENKCRQSIRNRALHYIIEK